MCNIIELKIKIKKLKLELKELVKKNSKINNKEVINKSQELDELIVLYTEKKYLAG